MTGAENWDAELTAIAEKCGIPPEQLQMSNGSVRVIASKSLTYGQVICVVGELRVRSLPVALGLGPLTPLSRP